MKPESSMNASVPLSNADYLIDGGIREKILFVFFFFGCLTLGAIYIQQPDNPGLAYVVNITCLLLIACAIYFKQQAKVFILLLTLLFPIALVGLVYSNGIVPTPLAVFGAMFPLFLLPSRAGALFALAIALTPLSLLVFSPEEATPVFSRIMAVNVCLTILMIILTARVRYITEQYRRSQQAALEASMAKSDFLASMSHEIRTPLNGIFGSLQIIRGHLDDSVTVGRYTNIAMQSYQSVIGIVNDILDLSKLAQDKVEIYPEPSNVSEIIALVTSELKAVALNKGVDLSSLCAAEVDAQNRLIDRTRLAQVLRNLIANALKFTDSGGVKIEARLGASSDEVVFIISDTGVGIPEDKLEKIFEPFEQSDASRNTERSGTGLGLAISKKLVELMDGSIDVKSEMSRGSQFTVRVKLPETEAPRADERGAIDITKLHPARILLAEDVATNRMIFGALLKNCPYTIDEAINGAMAVEKALAQEYDLVFMDIQMPVMDGLSAISALNAANYAKPVIACTANVMKEDVEEYMAAGFASVIGKPYLKEDLVANIQAAVTRESFTKSFR